MWISDPSRADAMPPRFGNQGSRSGRGRARTGAFAAYRRPASVLLLLAALGLAGCQSGGGWGGAPVISGLHLFGVSVALNFDQQPGPDGFVIRVYASRADAAKGVAITRGTLEVLMFDGVLPDNTVGTNAPARVWSYGPAELKGRATATTLGVGYAFAERWGETVPTGDRITVVARYTALSGRVLISAPSAISLVAR